MAIHTALQFGLVPGYALQDGDKIAALLGNALAGSMGLGDAASTGVDLTSSSNNSATGAYQVVGSVTQVSTATTTGNSIQLVPIAPNTTLRIYNDSLQVLNVFPPANQRIDGGAVGAKVTLAAGARCEYLYLGANSWVSDLLGTKSA